MAQTSNASTDLPPLLFHQSYLAAAAAGLAAAAGVNSAQQQDLLKCLNSVLPQTQTQSQLLQTQTPHFIIPGVVQAATTAATTAAAASDQSTNNDASSTGVAPSTTTVVLPIAKLSPPLSVAVSTYLELSNAAY